MQMRRNTMGGHRGIAVAAAVVAASAWFGAAGLVFDFLGFPARLADRLPFGSTVIGGLSLAVVVAVPYSLLAVAAWRDAGENVPWAVACGVLMIAWIAVEVAVIREFSPLQPLMAALGAMFVVAGGAHQPRRSIGQ